MAFSREFFLCAASPEDTEALVTILHDADEDDARIRAALSSNALNSYGIHEGQDLVGAAVVRWAVVPTEKSEIILLAVDPSRRRQGIGQSAIALLAEEASRRSVRVLLVGTGNVPVGNIAFYQKCGFRMSHVRRDHFDYIQPPLVVEGTTLHDMIVFERIIADRNAPSQV